MDSVLASGTKNGYLFAATYSRTRGELLWIATARPEIPAHSGDRYFAVNHDGVIFYTLSAPFLLDDVDCTIPAGVHRVGE